MTAVHCTDMGYKFNAVTHKMKTIHYTYDYGISLRHSIEEVLTTQCTFPKAFVNNECTPNAHDWQT